ncbi:hypothetical protein ACHAXR_012751 [Thalassiosira sp. AJA248-18]
MTDPTAPTPSSLLPPPIHPSAPTPTVATAPSAPTTVHRLPEPANDAGSSSTPPTNAVVADPGNVSQDPQGNTTNNNIGGDSANATIPSSAPAFGTGSSFGSCIAVPVLPPGTHHNRRKKRFACKHPGCSFKSSSSPLCPLHNMRMDCDPVATTQQEGECVTQEADDTKPGSSSGQECARWECAHPATMGGYCKAHYDTLVEEASLLNNLFYSSNASDASSGESGGEEDAQSAAAAADDDEVGDGSGGQMMMRCDSLSTTPMIMEDGGDAVNELDKAGSSEEVQEDIPQESSAPANEMGNIESLVVAATESYLPDSNYSNQSIAASSPSSTVSNNSSFSLSSKQKSNKDRTGHPKLNGAAVDYLRAWMLSRQHIQQPYPSDQMYAQLGLATGLEKNQLKNWFVNNRRRLWRPMMNEMRQKYGLHESDPLPLHVLDTLEDEPRPPLLSLPPQTGRVSPPSTEGQQQQPASYSSADVAPSSSAEFCPLDPSAPISAVADSVAAAAMMLMTGSSRATSPTTSVVQEEIKDDVVADVNATAVQDQVMEPVKSNLMTTSVSTEEATKEQQSCLPPRPSQTLAPQVPRGKEQVKFNVGGTIVQVTTDVLLKYPESRMASIARSAMQAGDMAIPIPRDYQLFSHCVFYLCNDRVTLPPHVSRKVFLKEMIHFGIPYDVKCISGGLVEEGPVAKLPEGHRTHQISPTTVTQLHHSAAAPEEASVSRPLSSTSRLCQSTSQQNNHTATDMRITPAVTATKPTSTSPLDLLSSAVSSSGSWSSNESTKQPAPAAETRAKKGTRAATSKSSRNDSGVRMAMCSKCDACLREDCGKCNACLDKPKFGGKNRMRKKCFARKCFNMVPHSFVTTASAKKRAKEAVAKLDKKSLSSLAPPFPVVAALPTSLECAVTERTVNTPNLAIVALEKRWSENLEHLRPCIEAGGLINYAIIEDEEVRKKINHFVKEQRKSFRRKENGESTSMTEERLKLLREANFPFVHKPYPKSNSIAALATFLIQPKSEKPESPPVSSVSPVEPVKPVTSSLDLLCSIMGDHVDIEATAVTQEDVEEEEIRPPTPPPASTSSKSKSSKQKVTKARGPNCGNCTACLRKDCGECRECLDKPKFGGPNTIKRRCANRFCLQRERQYTSNASDGKPSAKPTATNKESDSRSCRKPSKKSEEARMQAELAQIRAELDAKAQGVKFGFADMPQRRSGRTIEKLLRELEEEDSDDDDDMESSDSEESEEEDEVMEDVDEDSPDELSNAVFKTAMAATGVVDLPRGVTVRPSGKWQVQLYYAGFSRYIGLFDTREEAAVGYEIARECCNSFEEEDPTPEQVKRNLDLMRKAAFEGGWYTSRASKRDESKGDDTTQDKPKKKNVPGKRERSDDAAAQAVLAKAKAGHAKAKAQTCTFKKSQMAKHVAVGSQRLGSIEKKSLKEKRKEIAEDAVMEDSEESRKRKFSSEIYQKAQALAEALPRGITVRPSGKWQVQVYYAGKSRYIGVFDSNFDAAVAYELARDCLNKFKDDVPSPEEAKKNVILMRKAAFSFSKGDNKRQKKNADALKMSRSGRTIQPVRKHDEKKPKSISESKVAPTMPTKPSAVQVAPPMPTKPSTVQVPPPMPINPSSIKGAPPMPTKPPTSKSKRASPMVKKVDTTKATRVTEKPKVVENKKPRKVVASPAKTARTAPLPGVAASGNIKDLPEIGPGWKVSIVPRSTSDRSDYYYFSPTGKKFRSFQQAKRSAEADGVKQNGQVLPATSDHESSSGEEPEFGAVGYKFRKQFLDESGGDLGWFDGEVVDIVSGAEKDRKCFFAADGYIEDLSLAELQLIAELESNYIGAVGFKFKKQFPDGKWYNGAVLKILPGVENGKDRRCRYEDDDFEDLSIVDLRNLVQLEKTKNKRKREEQVETEEVQHNDLCETCGTGGELLCCSTCNLVFHLGCTRPKLTELPVNDWCCPFCVSSGDIVKNTSKQDQQKASVAVREIEALKEEVRKNEESRRKSARVRKNSLEKF